MDFSFKYLIPGAGQALLAKDLAGEALGGLGPNDAAKGLTEQGTASYGRTTQQADEFSRYLAGQVMNPNAPSVAQKQTEANFGQAIAGQQALAAGARPGQAGSAQRFAAQNAGLLMGQGAQAGGMARLAERQGQQNMYGNLLLGQRGQDVQALTGAAQVPTTGQAFLGGLAAVAPYALASDERLKTDIEDGDDDADAFMRSIRPLRFKYKDEQYGKGDQVGILAQDLEKTTAGRQAVIETPAGKMVHGAKLAGALAAAVARLERRVTHVEGAR